MSIPLEIVSPLLLRTSQTGCSSGSPSEEKGLEILVQQAPQKNEPLLPLNELDALISKLVSWNGVKHVSDRDLMNGKVILGCLTEKLLQLLCIAAEHLFAAEPSLLELSGPITIVGNLYSHFRDLQRILRSGGLPPLRKYLFLGNVVTRGDEGIETLALLLALKVRYPQHVFVLRGNSETRDAARVYGFYEQCKQRVGLRQWKRFAAVFSAMPLAATVDQRVLCAAGGIGPAHLASPSALLATQLLGGAATRPAADLPDSGAIRELVVGHTDQPSAAALFSGLMQPHALELLVTSGRAVDHGFRVMSPQHVAVFSATEAVDEDNPAAVIHLHETQPQIRYTVQRFNPQPRSVPQLPSLSMLCARLIVTLDAKAQERVSVPTELREMLQSADCRTCAAPCCSRPRFFHEPLRTPEDTEVCSVHCYATRWQQPTQPLVS